MSVRVKILTIVLGFFSLSLAAFAVYSVTTTTSYKQLRTEEVSWMVAFESERVDRIITEMERNAIDLALAGHQFYNTDEHSDKLGISISLENFIAFTAAVGGGIWFEPFALGANRQRVCYYAFFDPSVGAVRHDPNFETKEDDYHTQIWYMINASGVDGRYHAVWTPPYYDEVRNSSLMATVGAGIYSDSGLLVGVSTVDWEIQSMVEKLSGIKPTPNTFILLASLKDDYIISNTYTNKITQTGSSLHDLTWYGKLNFASGDTVNISRFTEGGVEYISFSRLFDNGWLFSIQIPAQEIFAEIETRNNQFTVIIAVSSLILLLSVAYLLSRLINHPLSRLTSDVAELGSGNLDKKIEINSKDEFGTLAAAFNKMTIDLKASIEQNARERAEKERISVELNVAADIQTNMLPTKFPAFPELYEFDIYASMHPAKEVGGDFYDFFIINNTTLAVVIADVSGKGVPSALFMVRAKTLIKNNAQSGKSPREVLETVNNILCENNDVCMFVTLFIGYLDISSGKFTFSNAGHNIPLLYSGGSYSWLESKGEFILAVIKNTRYKQNKIRLKPGDKLFLYTDGITEAMNSEDAIFSDQRLIETANSYAHLPPKEFALSVKREIDIFTDKAEQADDITMLALHYIGGKINEYELVTESKLENTDDIIDYIDARLENCSSKIRNNIALAVEEIFSNIAHYAYYPLTGSVTIRMTVGREIVINFEDSGIEYNPLLKDDPDLSPTIEERTIGGLGIFITKNIMDSLEYQRTGNKNILTIRKKIENSYSNST
ncbi:MAG: SpoIIE family protein phosphatase [Deferribacteraceae bacterium]|jgi:sigma-B regulation protein RsbU (phosphoserine phosphatase)|nr:SpoIIE family protein phosphatase [Deferribacteraceae bacterium]